MKVIVSRRDFLRQAAALGGATAFASIIEGCSNAAMETESLPALTSSPVATQALMAESAPTSTPKGLDTVQPTSNPTMTPTEMVPHGTTRIAFIKTDQRGAGVRQAIDLLGINPVSGKRVFIKPNFNSADPTPGSTHLDVLSSLVTSVRDFGAQQITVGDRSGMGNTRQVMERLGVFKLAEDLGFEILVFDELPASEWIMIQPPSGHWKNGFPFARPCLEADTLVQTCCLKTHRYGGHFTLSLKNSVGMVAQRHPQMGHEFMQELHASSSQRTMIAEINAAYTPALIVMDAVEAFISGGPDQGKKVAPEVILAGTDRIAIDAVGVALLRYFGCKTEASRGKIFDQEQIARAVELGLGVDSPEKIEFVTADPDSAAYVEKIRQVLIAG